MTRSRPRLSPAVLLSAILGVFSLAPSGQPPPAGQKWVASWAASGHGPYPSGNASAQPVLDFAIESADRGAIDQTFRLIIRPDLWGSRVRLRFSNAFGTAAVSFDDVFVGLQAAAGNLVPGTNQRVTFDGGSRTVSIPAGRSAWSDPVPLPFVDRADVRLLDGRKLAVSFHTPAATGPMTWHAKALQTSYLTGPRAGSHGADETDAAFPFTTTSWYFLDALDVMAPADTLLVTCFGDSITDGTGSTLSGDDRWPDVLSRRLHAAHGSRVSVVNAGIGGNRITGPTAHSPQAPFAGGPSALDRLDRDVLGLSGLSAVVWLEGINDLSSGSSAEAVIEGLTKGVARLRARGIRIVGATITSALGAAGAPGTPDVDARRQAVNTFIRTSGIFDGVADFDRATRDAATGALRAEFQPGSTVGGPGDRLHPNRAGYQAMASAIDTVLFAPSGSRPARAASQDAPGSSPPPEYPGLALVWADEFNGTGDVDPSKWTYERGFVRNRELQWYQPQNARQADGLLIIEARRERIANPDSDARSGDWRRNREFAEYTSASLLTRGLHSWRYGRFEMRGRIDTRPGLWPAFWTLGVAGRWPHNGEIDIMEYYRGLLLANVAWGGSKPFEAVWADSRTPIDGFKQAGWAGAFHVWRMDWDEQSIELSVNGTRLNRVDLTRTINRDGSGTNPLHQPHYLLLNLAVGGTQGGDPAKTSFPARFEVDYVRVYQPAGARSDR